MRMPIAVGTSQIVIVISAVAGLAGRLVAGTSIGWALGLLFGAGGLVGATLGSRLADHVPAAGLRRAFAAVAVAVAGVLVWQVAA